MAWGEPQDYWWLKPAKPDNPLPAMQLGAQIMQQGIANAMKQKDQQLEAQRTGIQIQEYFSKKELQNRNMEGNAELAKGMSSATSMADPSVLENIWKIGEKYPGLMDTPQWSGALKLHENAVIAREKLAEVSEARLLRERTAVERELTTQRRLDIFQQQADTGTMRAEDLRDWREIQTDLAKAKQIANAEERSIVHGEIARRLDVFERNAASREAKMPQVDRIKMQHELNVLREQLDKYEITPEDYTARRKETYQKYTPQAGPAAAPASPSDEGFTLMFDKDGNTVRVPSVRLIEFKDKGYRMAR